jgi:hypothetical protein
MPPVASVRVRHASHLFSGLIMLNEKCAISMDVVKCSLAVGLLNLKQNENENENRMKCCCGICCYVAMFINKMLVCCYVHSLVHLKLLWNLLLCCCYAFALENEAAALISVSCG